ncbi:MAG: rhomboid family intramembrane serine protease [Proteobacteria bacterium]|nr:rhomboid family intramembrane serine protease [Pseudomonadota bacterium]
MSTPELVTVFRSPLKRLCNERLLVLTAVGLEGVIVLGEGEFRLEVDALAAPAALRQLAQYESENRPPPPPPPPPHVFPYAWVGCLAYAAVLFGVAAALSHGWWRLDAFEAGDLDAARVQAGQWWRAWTALTLHLDGPHLAANLLAGVWFGYLGATQLGVGTLWFLTVTAAAGANLIEGLWAPPGHHSVGASTAVFACLGAMSAYSWRERLGTPQRWARRWGPLIAGVVLLGWTGSAGEGTDLFAHVGGFAMGVLIGSVASLTPLRRRLPRVPQWLPGGAALASLALAWACALHS